MAATEEEFEAALDRANINAHDQHGQLRIKLRNHHKTTPWSTGTNITEWIMARYEEMHQQRLALRARSASATPTSSPTQETRPLPVQSQPVHVNISQNAIGGPPHVTTRPLEQQIPSASEQSRQADQYYPRLTPTDTQSQSTFVKTEERDDFTPSLAGTSTLTPATPSASYPVFASGLAISKVEHDIDHRQEVEDDALDLNKVEQAARDRTSSSPFEPLIAAVAPSDTKPRTQEISKPQVTVTIHPQESTAEQNATGINPDYMQVDAAFNPDFNRAVSVSSTSSSVIRPSPTPSVMQTEPERERSLKDSERVNFPSPPPSDSEFAVPIRQPFEQSVRDLDLNPRKTIKPIENHVPEMEWTRLAPEPQPTPPDSSDGSSSARSDGSDIEMPFGDADGDDVLQLTSAPRDKAIQQSDIRVDAASTASQVSSKKRGIEGTSANQKQKQSDASKGIGKKRSVPDETLAPRKKTAQLKEWERREFVAPREDELKDETSTSGTARVISFAKVRRLLPPDVKGSAINYQTSIDDLKRLLYPIGTARPVLYLNQLAWVVNQMATGPPEYRAVLGRTENLRLLEQILSDAYARSKSDTVEKKTNITIWRCIKTAFLTIQLLRKINPSDEQLNGTKIALRLREWCRRDEDIRNVVESWRGKNWLQSSDKGSTKNATASSSAAPKRKADIEDASTNKRPRSSAENARRDSTPGTAKSTNATGSGTAASKKGGAGDLMDSFLASGASTRPSRPVPAKKPPSKSATNDALAQAMASIQAAQVPVAEPEPKRKTPDPTRQPRTGKDGKPRPHMSVRWKEGPSLTSFRMIEARDPTESHDGSARAMEMEEGALLRKLLMWHPPREMEYRGSSDVSAVATEETDEQTRREQVFPAVTYTDESEMPITADETDVQIASLDDNVVRLIPLYKEEAQAAIPSHQYLQHNQQEAQAGVPQNRISNPSTPVVVPALPMNGNLNYGFPGQAPTPTNNGFPGANPLGATGLNFNVSALVQNLSGLQNLPGLVQTAGFNNQNAFNPQSPYNQVGFNAQQGYNPQIGYGQQPYNPAGYNMQQGFRPDPGYNAQPVYSPPTGQRRGPPIHPDRLQQDGREADRQRGNYRRRGA